MTTILYPVNELKIGGAEQQLLELVRGLNKDRYQPIVAPLYPGGNLDAEFRAVPGVEVYEVRRTGKYDPSPLWRIARLLQRRRVDIVQPFLSPATLFGLLPALVVGTRVTVVTERCGIRKNRGTGYKLYRTVEDQISHFADAIVPNSIAGRDLLLTRGLPERKIRVIYNGVNDERLTVRPEAVDRIKRDLSVPDDGAVVGILASLTPPKGHETLLRAVASIQDQFPGVRVAIVGDGPLHHPLEELSAQLGLSDRAVFFGYQRNVADFLAAFDVLVSASCDNEGCSNSILEAMALGVPVVATDIGGNRELVRPNETGALVPVPDVEALAAAMTRLLEDRELARVYAARAREVMATQFSLDRMVRDYEALYASLLEEAGRTAVDADGQMVILRG